MDEVGNSTCNKHEQSWRDDVHEVLQQARTLHEEDDTNRWKQWHYEQ
jgi:hypothetical protein